MEPAQKPEKPWFLDPGFIVPLLIFLVYFWMLSLTVGVYDYFHISQAFISLNPTTVLAKSHQYLVLLASGLLSVLLGLFYVDILEKKPRLRYWITACIMGFVALGAIWLAFDPGETLLWSLGICLAVFVVVITSICMDDLIARNERIKKESSSTSGPTIQYWNYLLILILSSAIGGGYFYFYHEGRSGAEKADTFYVVKQSGGGTEVPEVVLLGNYGDYLVVVPFHRDTRTFNSFMILKMPQAEKTWITFALEQVGPLRPAEVKPAGVKP